MTLTVGSMFSGIGGLDLGLERAGMTVVWQAENDPYCCRVLAKHWPHVPNLGDVTTIDWSDVERVDLVCGGYPCQPFSLAGRRLGDRDPRHLWPYVLDAVRVLRPRWVVLENVPGHLALGFGRVLGDLAEIGYDAEWDCIPAAAVGAPHRRDRVFVVAYPHGGRHGRTQDARRVGGVDRGDAGTSRKRERSRPLTFDRSSAEHVADAHGERSQGRGLSTVGRTPVPDTDGSSPRVFRPTTRPGGQWPTEPDVGRVAHGVPARVDRLRALGNAVVPQVAEWIGHRIMEAAA